MSYSLGVKALIGGASDYIPKTPKLRRPRQGKATEIPKYTQEEWYTEEVERQLTRHSMLSAIVMTNNLHVLIGKTNLMWTNIKAKWVELCYASRVDSAFVDFDQLQQGLLIALNHNVNAGIEAIATRMVWFDMRHYFLGGLYVPNVEFSRVGTLLDEMDKRHLPLLMSATVIELARPMCVAVVRSCIQVFERVVFNGGVRRLFKLEDGTKIRDDLFSLVRFFAPSDRSGLDPDLFADEVKALERALIVLEMQTKQLLQVHEQGMAADKTKPSRAGDDPFAPYNVIRVLAHRDDKESRRFCKKMVPDFGTGAMARPMMEVLDFSSRFSRTLKEGPEVLRKSNLDQQDRFEAITKSATEDEIRARPPEIGSLIPSHMSRPPMSARASIADCGT